MIENRQASCREGIAGEAMLRDKLPQVMKVVLVKRFILMACLITAPAFASVRYQWDLTEWVPLEISKNGQWFLIKDNYEIDLPAKVGRNFAVKQRWFAFDYADVKTETANRELILVNLSCSDRRMMIVSSISYSQSGAAIKSFHDKDDYDFNYSPSVPDSYGNAMIDSGCGFTPLPKRGRCTKSPAMFPDMPVCP